LLSISNKPQLKIFLQEAANGGDDAGGNRLRATPSYAKKILKEGCFRLASNDLLAASSSEGKAVRLRATWRKRGASSSFSIAKAALKLFQKAANG